jgi:hypothetical protein
MDRQLGNKFFMSLSQLKKNVSSRRDDLEQLFYTLSFLAKGDLPWSLKASYTSADIIKAKSSPAIMNMLLDELPEQFRAAFNYISSLGFTEEPNYDYLISLFNSIMESPKSLRNYSYSRPCPIVTPAEILTITEREKKLILTTNNSMSGYKNNQNVSIQSNSTQASINLELSQNTPNKMEVDSESRNNRRHTNTLYQSQELRNYINGPDSDCKLRTAKMQQHRNSGNGSTESSGTYRDEEFSGEQEDSAQAVKYSLLYKKQAKPNNLRIL